MDLPGSSLLFKVEEQIELGFWEYLVIPEEALIYICICHEESDKTMNE